MKKIYCVELKEPQEGENRLNFFGSQAAIFQHMEGSRLGISYSSLRSHVDLRSRCYENGKCRIILGRLLQAKRNLPDPEK